MVIKRNQETVAVDFRLSRSLAQVLSSLVGKIKKKRKKSSNQKRLNSRRFGVSLYQLDPSYRALLPFLGFFPPFPLLCLPSLPVFLPFPPFSSLSSPHPVFLSYFVLTENEISIPRLNGDFVHRSLTLVHVILFYFSILQVRFASTRIEMSDFYFFFFFLFSSLSREILNSFIHSFVRSFKFSIFNFLH